MANDDLIRKGYAAKAMLENSDFKIALDTVKVQAFRAWSQSAPADLAAREEHYNLLRAIDKLTDNLQALVDSGRIEEHNAELKAKQQKTEQELHQPDTI